MSFKNSKRKVNCVNRSVYSGFFMENERTIIENPWELKGGCTVSNSIFSYFTGTDLLIYDYPFTVWFEETVNLFKFTRRSFEKHLGLSFDPKHLIEIEIINLSTFFETGKYVSKSLYRGMMSDDVHQFYTRLLWGEDVWIGCSGTVLEDRLDKLEQYIAEGQKKKIEILSEVMQEDLEEDWMSSSKLQALLWLRNYLKDDLKEEDINKICLKYKRELPFAKPVKQGFQVMNKDKDKVVSALYKALIGNRLIAEIEIDDFKKAFLGGQGSIQWVGGKDKLGYLIRNLKTKKIITNKNHMAMVSNIFSAKEKIDSNSLGSGADGISETNETLMKNIITEVVNAS